MRIAIALLTGITIGLVVSHLGTVAANAQLPQNLGNVPGNGAAALPNCSEVSFLGPMIIAYCTNRSNLVIKSSIDVRACAGYLVAEDNASGRLVCRQRGRAAK